MESLWPIYGEEDDWNESPLASRTLFAIRSKGQNAILVRVLAGDIYALTEALKPPFGRVDSIAVQRSLLSALPG